MGSIDWCGKSRTMTSELGRPVRALNDEVGGDDRAQLRFLDGVVKFCVRFLGFLLLFLASNQVTTREQ